MWQKDEEKGRKFGAMDEREVVLKSDEKPSYRDTYALWSRGDRSSRILSELTRMLNGALR